MATTLASPVRETSRTGLLALLSLGFILSGIATTIIGPMLPVFIGRWRLDDAQAGVFPMVQFLAALVGTGCSWLLSVKWGYKPAVVLGYALIGYGLATLNAAAHANALLATSVFGLGYGLITPGTNLYVAEAGGARSASLLNLLNFAWGIGAMACSPLIALVLRRDQISGLLIGYGVFGALLALSLLFTPFNSEKREQLAPTTNGKPPAVSFGIVAVLAILFFTYVAMENGIGVWSAEYSRRVAGAITNLSTLAPMFFYAGLTAGRGLAPLALLRIRENPLVLGALTLVCVSTVAVISASTVYLVIAGVFAAGLGCACIYPMLIAWFSRWSGPSAKRFGGLLFALASLGGSAGPRLIGMVSKQSGSLRMGFLVPVLSAVIMFFLIVRLRRQAVA